MPTNLMEAAQLRAAQVRAPADRPSQRRSAEFPQSGSRAVFRARMELTRAAGDAGPLGFHGLASATESPYEMWDFFGPYTEIVSAGAFAQTLARADLDVPLVIGHNQIRRIARTTTGTLQLAEIAEGLDVRAPDLDPTDVDVAYVAPKLAAGLLDEMSFAFQILSGQWSPDYTEFRINAVELHRGDVSIVGFGANPATSGGLVKAAAAEPPAKRSTGLTRAVLDAIYLR